MLSRIRERAKGWITPLARVFARSGLTPNMLTMVGLIFGVVAALLFAWGEQLLAGVLLLVAGFFDVIDGAVARLLQKETAFGGVLDSVVDRYVDFLLYAGISYALINHRIAEPEILLGWGWAWCLLAIAGSFMVSYTRARAEAAGSGRLDVGFAERAERMIILAIGALLGLTPYAVVVIAVIANLTVVQRLWVTRQRLH
ncbi:MAG: CDP-alcohol phosphatidyltransferase family protein [Candidatus Hadarchaeum sp.]|uniref:CDP-alcohol phosphatidyltransferase family protein n=1 Tax=Candidatus Hadarchaeum sp. TaxID=2883567 RepID=UPI003D0D8674